MLFISLSTLEDARGNVEEDSADVDTIEKLESVEDGTKESLRHLYSWNLITLCAMEVHFIYAGPMLNVDNGSKFHHPRTSWRATIEA
jgi:hypothetical protein